MKTRNFQLLLPVLLLIGCSAKYNQAEDVLKSDNISLSKENKPVDNKVFTKVYSLKKKDNTIIGDIYARYINDTIFTDLFVINKTDTLYSIIKNILSNKQGKDIEALKDGFWGYQFILKKDDYFVLSNFRNKGANVSDDITIEWNYDKDILEVQKVP